jgi:phosphomevalonate kinase
MARARDSLGGVAPARDALGAAAVGDTPGAVAIDTFARPVVQRRRWPASVALIPFFTGVSADTATLVARVEAARVANRDAVEAALAAIAAASRAACDALDAPEDLAATALIGAVRIGAQAIDRLAIASGVDLVPACVGGARRAMHALGGTAKTTGAGGGDIGVAVIPSTADRSLARSLLIEAGCLPLHLSVDETGVDTRPEPK